MPTDLDDSVSLGEEEHHTQEEHQSQYRRLRRQGAEKQPSPGAIQIRASPPGSTPHAWNAAEDHQEADANFWDEEDEYAERLHKADRCEGSPGADLSASMQSDEHSNAGEQEVEEDGYVGGDINADTQRLLRGQAKFDALGKGHEPVIKPLTGVLSKLKVHAEQVKARAAPVAPQNPAFEAVLAKRQVLLAEDNASEEELELVSDECDDQTYGEAPTTSNNHNSSFANDSDNEDSIQASGDDDDNNTEMAASGDTQPPAASQDGDDDNSGEIQQVPLRPFSRIDSRRVAHEKEPSAPGEEEPNTTDTDDATNAVDQLMRNAAARAMRDVSKAVMARATRFYEIEAELSDEDGEGGAMVSEDEEEGDEDEQGRDLADLIDTNAPQAMDKDDAQQKQLHAAWEAEQEAAALKHLVEGVRTGFRRVGDQFGDDGDVRLARLRRAAGYEDDGTFNPALLDVDTLLHGGLLADDTAGQEDGLWMRAFKRRKALATVGCAEVNSDVLPLDGRSLMVDELIHAAGTNEGMLQRAGSNNSGLDTRAGSQPLDRKSSFLGRAGAIKSTGASIVNLANGNSRSYVFGKEELSRDAGVQQENCTTDPKQQAPTTGPTTFVGLCSQIEAMTTKRKGRPALLGVLNDGGHPRVTGGVDVGGVLKGFSDSNKQ